MLNNERIIAGVSCGEVLEELSEYVDGNLSPERVQQLRDHVSACHLCERFGADFVAALDALRTVGDAPPLDPEMAERLRQALVGE